jgi:hypothetical protein
MRPVCHGKHLRGGRDVGLHVVAVFQQVQPYLEIAHGVDDALAGDGARHRVARDVLAHHQEIRRGGRGHRKPP